MRQHKNACWVERMIGGMAAATMVLMFVGGLLLVGCAPVQIAPECQDSMQAQPGVDVAMTAGAIGLSEYLIEHPEDRSDAKKAVRAAIVVLKQEVVTLDVLVSALQKGISSAKVRQRLGYVAVLGVGRQSGVALNQCDREYLAGYFKRLEGMI